MAAGFEPAIKVLQTTALPLGYAIIFCPYTTYRETTSIKLKKKLIFLEIGKLLKIGASYTYLKGLQG
jgi:hypothetical protein